MAESKDSSLTKTITLIGITAIVSGLIGGYINDYFSRAKPSMTLLSVGFQNPIKSESVELPANISRETQQAPWVEELERYEPFQNVIDAEVKVSGWIQEANELVSALESWKKNYITRLNHKYSKNDILSVNALWEHPFFSSKLGGAVFTARIRAGVFNEPSYKLVDIESQPKLIEFEDQDKKSRWAFFLRYKVQLIPYENQSSEQRSGTKVFVNSFGRGITQNVLEYSDIAIAGLRKDILDAQRLQQTLREAVLPNSTIALTVVLYNSGKSPVTFQPHFGLRIEHEKYKEKTYILSAVSQSVEESSNPFELTSGGFTIDFGGKNKGGKSVEVEPFLPETEAQSYVTVPGGGVVKLELLGREPLGKSAKALLSLHETDLLKARVFGITFEGSIVPSAITPFSLSIDKDSKSQLENAKIN